MHPTENVNYTAATEPSIVTTYRTYERRTIKMDSDVYYAARIGDYSVFHTYSHRPLSEIRTCGGNSVLHVYLEFGTRVTNDFIRKVLELDRTLLYARNNNEELPHHVAAKRGLPIALETLLDIGGNTYLEMPNKEGYNVLHLAIQKEHVETVRYLVGVANSDYVKVKNQYGDSPLHMAISTQILELVDILVKKDCDLITLQDDHNQTPLHCAAKEKNNPILNLLLDCASLEALAMQDNCGQTIGHVAAKVNDVASLKLLVHRVPDFFERIDLTSQNVVHYAALEGCGEALQYFFENKDQHSILLDKKDNDGNTPLHLLTLSLSKFSVHSTSYIKQHVIPHIEEPLMREKNKGHQTPQDILAAHDTSAFHQYQKDLVTDLMNVALKRGQNKVAPFHCERDPTIIYVEDKKLLKKADKRFATPAFIATLSSTAGLAVPGGFNQNQNDPVYGGTAMLLDKPGFKAFFIFDGIALTFSLLALIIYFFVALVKWKAETLFNAAYIATGISIFAFLLAFMAGTYSIAWKSSWLVIVMSVMIACPVLAFGVLLWCSFKNRSHRVTIDT